MSQELVNINLRDSNKRLSKNFINWLIANSAGAENKQQELLSIVLNNEFIPKELIDWLSYTVNDQSKLQILSNIKITNDLESNRLSKQFIDWLNKR